jgi:hypothetical protein
MACLKENGCEEGQGYLFGKAIPAAEIPALLKLASAAADARISGVIRWCEACETFQR